MTPAHFLLLTGAAALAGVVLRLASRTLRFFAKKHVAAVRRARYARLKRVTRLRRRVVHEVRDCFFPDLASGGRASSVKGESQQNAEEPNGGRRELAARLGRLLGGLRAIGRRRVESSEASPTLRAAVHRFAFALFVTGVGIPAVTADAMLLVLTFPEYGMRTVPPWMPNPAVLSGVAVAGGLLIWGGMVLDQFRYTRARLFEGRGMVALSLCMLGLACAIAIEAGLVRAYIGALHTGSMERTLAVNLATSRKIELTVMIALFVTFTAAITVGAFKELLAMLAGLVLAGVVLPVLALWNLWVRAEARALLIVLELLRVAASVARRPAAKGHRSDPLEMDQPYENGRQTGGRVETRRASVAP